MSKHQSRTRTRQESSEKSTFLVRSGSAVVRVYTRQRKGKRQYTVAWYTGGKRRRQFCRTSEQAQKFAKAFLSYTWLISGERNSEKRHSRDRGWVRIQSANGLSMARHGLGPLRLDNETSVKGLRLRLEQGETV